MKQKQQIEELKKQLEVLKNTLAFKEAEIKNLNDKIRNIHTVSNDRIRNLNEKLEDSVRKDFCLELVAAATGNYNKKPF